MTYGAAKYFNVTEETLDPNRPFSSNATSARFIWPLVAMNSAPTVLTAVLNSLGRASLASQSELFAGNQQPLPKNQWQLDVLRWWHIILAAIQASRLAPEALSKIMSSTFLSPTPQHPKTILSRDCNITCLLTSCY